MEAVAILTCVNERWSPQIGDPSVLGWLTVLAYAVAALLSARCARVQPEDRRFWQVLALLLAALCVNKQLDLQSAMTATARCIALAEGWYDDRRPFQIRVIKTIVAAGFLGLCVAIWHFRAALPRIRLAMVGTALLVTFVAVRAVGFHDVDTLIGLHVGPARMNWILELSGLVLITINAASVGLGVTFPPLPRRAPR